MYFILYRQVSILYIPHFSAFIVLALLHFYLKFMTTTKELLRQETLLKRDGLRAYDVSMFSEKITESFLSLDEYKSAVTIAFYSSVRSEVSTKLVIEKALAGGKEVYLPRVKEDSDGVDFVRVTGLEGFKKGSYGILEPVGDDVMDPGELDLIVLPGVAFDESGARIGYGKGHYDMTLEKVTCKKIAFAFEQQIVEKIETEPHDVNMDLVITEKRIIGK